MKPWTLLRTRMFVFAAALSCAQICAARAEQPEITLDIDSPNAQSGPYMGLATFSGWAVDNANPIGNFATAVDGVPVGPVKYGVYRGDVCAAVPGPSCPNVGWSLTLDTTQLTDGSHTLTISASSASGDYSFQKTSFTVANWSGPSVNPIKMSIDAPGPQSAPASGTASFWGWAIDSTAPIAGVSAAVDGIEYGKAFYGSSRPDVCNVYGNKPGCPNVGWAFQLDTTALPDGPHVLAVTSTSVSGQSYTTTSRFAVANSGPSNHIRISVDTPNGQSHAFSGVASFGGWALDDTSSVGRVSVAVDGNVKGDATTGIFRGDVCAVFPGRSGCPNVGWAYKLDTTVLSAGAHTLEVTAHSGDGRQSTIAAPFTVNQSSGISANLAGTVKVGVRSPAAAGAMLTGNYVFEGFALDDVAPISSVSVNVDGNAYNATYGLADSAACMTDLGAPNCPNAGWSVLVDTNQLSNGSHTLSVVATSADGQHAAAFSSFLVGNWTAANPMTLDMDTPNANSPAFTGMASFSGWAVDRLSALSSVAILVDGVSYGLAVYGDYRQDVCNALPGEAGCPYVGWHSFLDTTQLSNGQHTLTIMGTTAAGDHSTASTPFSVSNPTRVSIDSPGPQGSPFSGTASFFGWALNDNAAISSVQVFVDGIAYQNAVYGTYRADVCQAFPGHAGCPNVGWAFSLNTSFLANGPHTFRITASTANNQQASSSAAFVVEHSGPVQLGQRSAGRILDEATWGPTPTSLQALQVEGFDQWFQDQLSAPMSAIPDQPIMNADGTLNFNYAPVTQQFFRNAVTGPDQLRQRVAFALSEIWVVSGLQVNLAPALPPLLRIFQNRAFDNYENLMKDVTLNPAMGAYLNMANNVKGNGSQGTSANENYAREVMQLMTIGLNSLNMDGTPVLDANGNSIPNYTQSDVSNLARALTGWTYAPMPGAASKQFNPAYFVAPMVAFEADHDGTAKQYLGVAVPAGQTAAQDVTTAIHTLFLQPSLPPFISKQLIQHLVTSNPSPDYVSRVASVFADNGNGVRGDLSAVVYAILTDPEARAGDDPTAVNQSDFGHLREPVLFVANVARALNTALSSTSQIANLASYIGQPVYQEPSVFSYFSPFYTTTNGLLAPEFQLYTTQVAAAYVDAAFMAVFNTTWTGGTTTDLSPFIAAASNSDSLIDLINTEFLHQSISDNLKNAIYTAVAPLTLPSDRAKAALFTTLTSNEYLIVH